MKNLPTTIEELTDYKSIPVLKNRESMETIKRLVVILSTVGFYSIMFTYLAYKLGQFGAILNQ